MGWWNYLKPMIFDRHINSTAVEMPVQFPDGWTIDKSYIIAFAIFKIWPQDTLLLSGQSPRKWTQRSWINAHQPIITDNVSSQPGNNIHPLLIITNKIRNKTKLTEIGLQLTHLPQVLHICVSESGQHWLWLVAYSGPSHYLNQCWIIVNWTLMNKIQLNFNQNTKFFSHENASENIVCEIVAILSRCKWVKYIET